MTMSKRDWLRQREQGATIEFRTCVCGKPCQVELYPDNTFAVYHYREGGFSPMTVCPVTGAALDGAWYTDSEAYPPGVTHYAT